MTPSAPTSSLPTSTVSGFGGGTPTAPTYGGLPPTTTTPATPVYQTEYAYGPQGGVVGDYYTTEGQTVFSPPAQTSPYASPVY